MPEHVLTRQMWCERCAKANRPYRDLQFIVCGETGFHLRTVEKYVPKEHRGFTPHLVAPYKILDDKNIAISRVCCIIGCGLSLNDDPTDRNKQVFTYLKVSYDQLLIADWNNLVEHGKDLGYKI
jgi:hypothetical protein